MASDYRYSVHFEDGRRVTTNYLGDVLQVGDVFTFEGQSWVITDAKALSERDVGASQASLLAARIELVHPTR
jgi:hypothetical protein